MKVREINEENTRDIEIADLEYKLSSNSFSKSKRREMERHRKELIKAKHDEERENIRLAKENRKEQDRQAKWAKKSIDAETATILAEERQRDALAKDRKRRARRRRVNNFFDFIGKVVTTALLILGILCISNKAVRARVAITFNNIAEVTQHWADGDIESSNKVIDNLLEKGFDIDEEE